MPSDFFLENPVNLSISRSKFSLSHKNTLTFSPGRLVPILAYSDILPGDTFKLDCSFVCRSTTPIAPVMDDADIQIEFYFVPHKLVLSRAYMSPSTADSNHSFAAFIGAQDSLLNMPLPGDISLPALNYYIHDSSPAGAAYRQSVMHYLGYPFLPGIYGKVPAGVTGVEFFLNPLPALAFYAVWNENYREPNLFNPVTFSINSGTVVFTNNADANVKATNVSNGGLAACGLPPVCRYHGYFGSCLPWPQRNSASVTLPLGESADLYLKDSLYTLKDLDGGTDNVLKFGTTNVLDSSLGDTDTESMPLGIQFTGPAAKNGQGVIIKDGTTASAAAITQTNLAVNLENATAASINTIRTAFAYQRWFEQLARSGNRIQDVTRMFGVIPHDMADDRPVYLGGKRLPLTQTQVENTSGTSYSTATQQSIGSTGAYSLTSGSDHYFTKSFDTWGTLIGVCCVRCKDSFGNLVPKMLTRKNRFDFYWPQFANLGEQPVYRYEIDGSAIVDEPDNLDEVFGYQEYAAEYRYIPDRVTGEVNGDLAGSVGYWTYANNQLYYDDRATLKGFLDASQQVDNFNQTLQVSDATAGFTFLAQFYFNIIASRPMPMYSIPGLLDHH